MAVNPTFFLHSAQRDLSTTDVLAFFASRGGEETGTEVSEVKAAAARAGSKAGLEEEDEVAETLGVIRSLSPWTSLKHLEHMPSVSARPKKPHWFEHKVGCSWLSWFMGWVPKVWVADNVFQVRFVKKEHDCLFFSNEDNVYFLDEPSP